MSNQFQHFEEIYQQLGQIYRELKKEYGLNIVINYVDPINITYLTAYFFKHWRRRNIRFIKVFTNLMFRIKSNTIFVNGIYIENSDEIIRIIEKMYMNEENNDG